MSNDLGTIRYADIDPRFQKIFAKRFGLEEKVNKTHYRPVSSPVYGTMETKKIVSETITNPLQRLEI